MLSQLPDEIIELIIDYFPDYMKIQSYIYNNNLRPTLYIQFSNRELTTELSTLIKTDYYFRNIKIINNTPSITLISCFNITTIKIYDLYDIEYFYNIEKFNPLYIKKLFVMYDSNLINTKNLSKLSKLKNLEILAFSSSFNFPLIYNTSLLTLPNLKELYTSYTFNQPLETTINGETVSLFTGLPNLQKITLGIDFNHSLDGLLILKNLKEIRIHELYSQTINPLLLTKKDLVIERYIHY